MIDNRSVYQTGKGSVCPKCGWLTHNCRCSNAGEEPVPARARDFGPE